MRVEGLLGFIPKVEHRVNANGEIIYSAGFDADEPTLSKIEWSRVE